jgi:hypothetical protein
VRAVTSPSPQEGEQRVVHEMEMSADAFEERRKSGGDWTVGTIGTRELFDPRKPEYFERHRTQDELDCSYLMSLMKRVEGGGRRSFSLFLISQIKEERNQHLTEASLDDLARELRDMYFVYVDALHHCMHVEEDLPHEPMKYRHGPIDIQLFAAQQESRQKHEIRLHKSLRCDAPDELLLSPREYLAQKGQVDEHGNPVGLHLIAPMLPASAAPDPAASLHSIRVPPSHPTHSRTPLPPHHGPRRSTTLSRATVYTRC